MWTLICPGWGLHNYAGFCSSPNGSIRIELDLNESGVKTLGYRCDLNGLSPIGATSWYLGSPSISFLRQATGLVLFSLWLFPFQLWFWPDIILHIHSGPSGEYIPHWACTILPQCRSLFWSLLLDLLLKNFGFFLLLLSVLTQYCRLFQWSRRTQLLPKMTMYLQKSPKWPFLLPTQTVQHDNG